MGDAPETKDIVAGGIRFTVASRPQRRFSNTQTVNNLTSGGSLAPIQLPATGFVRRISLLVTATYTTSAAAAIVAGDAPFNLISGVTLTDATGQPVVQPVAGYTLSRVDKYFGYGANENTNIPRAYLDPMLGPEYAFAASGTSGSATFRLTLNLEQDYNSGYGCIPNLDSNASLQLKIDYAATTAAFSGGTASAATLTVRVEQHYWAPVGALSNGVPAMTTPVGFGDYLETRYETQTVSASTENTVQVTNRGGLIKGIMVISRAAGVRTAFTAATNVGLIVDNNPVDEGIQLESFQDSNRRMYGFVGAELTTSYAPITAGTLPGLDRGVLVWNFGGLSGGRDSWLTTRVGSLVQLKITPGASATSLEIVTLIAQVRDSAAFYSSSALD